MIVLLYAAAAMMLFLATILYLRSQSQELASQPASDNPRTGTASVSSRSAGKSSKLDIRDRMARMDREQLLEHLEQQFQNSPSSPESK